MLEDNMGHRMYKNVNLQIKYSGKILVGDDFIRDYYIHIGYQRAWAYKTLIEFVFEDGNLIETIDHSDIAERLRKEIDDGRRFKEERKNIPFFVADSFWLNMKDKAWWIK